MNLPSIFCMLLITLTISRHGFADQLDPIEDLILYLNPRKSSTKDRVEYAARVQENCNNDIRNAGDLGSKFPTPIPNDVAYNSSGFRKYGDTCSLEAERQFYEDLLNIVKMEASNITDFTTESILQPSSQYYLEQYSTHWKTWQANNKSFDVCNPRWLLECGKLEGEDVCVCLSKGITGLHYTIELEPEEQRNDGCNDAGKCGIDSAEPSTPYRCVAKAMDASTSTTDENEETVSGCEISLPVFGICQIDCNVGNACTALDPSRLNLKNEKFRNRKVCCSVLAGCIIDKKKELGAND